MQELLAVHTPTWTDYPGTGSPKSCCSSPFVLGLALPPESVLHLATVLSYKRMNRQSTRITLLCCFNSQWSPGSESNTRRALMKRLLLPLSYMALFVLSS